MARCRHSGGSLALCSLCPLLRNPSWVRDVQQAIDIFHLCAPEKGHFMLRSFLIGLVAGQRGISPLAAVAVATFRQEVPAMLPLQKWMLHPTIVAGGSTLAAAEMVGDKMKTAPDRVVPIGLAVRSITAAYAGAALAPRQQRAMGAALAVGTAMLSSYIGWRIRCAAMERYGQTRSGLVEDVIVVAASIAIINPGFGQLGAKAGTSPKQRKLLSATR